MKQTKNALIKYYFVLTFILSRFANNIPVISLDYPAKYPQCIEAKCVWFKLFPAAFRGAILRNAPLGRI